MRLLAMLNKSGNILNYTSMYCVLIFLYLFTYITFLCLYLIKSATVISTFLSANSGATFGT